MLGEAPGGQLSFQCLRKSLGAWESKDGLPLRVNLLSGKLQQLLYSNIVSGPQKEEQTIPFWILQAASSFLLCQGRGAVFESLRTNSKHQQRQLSFLQHLLPNPGTDALPAGKAVTVMTSNVAVGSLDSGKQDTQRHSSAGEHGTRHGNNTKVNLRNCPTKITKVERTGKSHFLSLCTHECVHECEDVSGSLFFFPDKISQYPGTDQVV